MYTIRSDSPRSRRCIGFIFDPAVLQSKDEPTSIFDAKMKDRNHDLNRTIGVSKIVFHFQFKLPDGGYADYNHDDFLDILSVQINLPIVSEIRTNNNVSHEAYFNHGDFVGYDDVVIRINTMDVQLGSYIDSFEVLDISSISIHQ